MLVSASAKPGGAEHAFHLLHTGLPDRGWEPISVVLERGELFSWLSPDAILLEAGRTRQLHHTASVIRSLVGIARREQVSTIVSSLSKSHVYGGTAAALAGIPGVRWQHDIPTRTMVEFVASSVPTRLIVCASEASAAAQRRLTPRRRVVVVNESRASDWATSGTETGETIRSAQGWGDGPVIGVVGRLQPGKGQDTFLDAAALVLRSHPSARFAVVGGAILGWEGDYADRLRQRAEALGIADRVHFAGHQTAMRAWYEALDIVVHASTIDAFGLVVLEAIRLGRPLIVARAGGATEVVEHERSGLVVPPADAEALALSIIRLIDDPELARRLGVGAVARAGHFTPERFLDEFTAVLDEASSGKRGRGR
jgi:glycosyltransferase involved in cell wall biosynthesis